MSYAHLIIPMLLLLPLVGAGLLLLIPRANVRLICHQAMIVTVLEFALCLLAAAMFDWSAAGRMQLEHTTAWVPAFGLSLSGGADALSMWFLLLTTFLMPLVMLESMTNIVERTGDRVKEYFLWLLLAESAMIGAFTATDLIYFYLCFEITLIPLFFLIGVFGSSNRLKAAAVFFLYSFTGSMLMLAGILYVAYVHATVEGAWSFAVADLVATAGRMSATEQAWVLGALLCGFGVKVPMWPVHTWLPLAHTEAPTAGSVILASVLLKLGTYGLVRFAIPLCPEAIVTYAPAIAVLGIIGILYAALVCWVQKDIKKLIAYSSVSHMGFCVLGIVALNLIGVGGSIFYMIAHGLSTGALFLVVGMMYNRLHTREMAELGGLGKVMPIWSTFLVFFCLASVGLPGLNGFVGEFLTLLGAFEATGLLGWPYALAAGLGMILAAIYILYMVGRVVFGPVRLPAGHGDDHPVRDLGAGEIAALAPIAAACLFFGLYPKPMLSTVEDSIEPIVARAGDVIAARRREIEAPDTRDAARVTVTLMPIDKTDQP